MAIKINLDQSFKPIEYKKYTIQEIKSFFKSNNIDIFQIGISFLEDILVMWDKNETELNDLATIIFDKELKGEVWCFHVSELPKPYIEQKYPFEQSFQNIQTYILSILTPEDPNKTSLRVDKVRIILPYNQIFNLDYTNEEHCNTAFGIFNENMISKMEYVSSNENFLLGERFLILNINTGSWDVYFKNGAIS